VEIDGQKFQLMELNGQERGNYLNEVKERIIMGPDGQTVGMKSFNGLEASLLKYCLYDPQGKPVTVQTLNEWPSGMLGDLFEDALSLSGLDKFSRKRLEQEAKND